jgi:DNA-binding winged helix-turn-helix (wHTH) protein/TolB-like protein
MKFGEFEADYSSGELRKNGVRVKIQDLPFRVLVIMLAHAGEVVTRDQLRAELWGAETFVDAEAGLNTAINKLRDALGDNADAPRFIETLPKRGYRFIGAIEAAGSLSSGIPAVERQRPGASRVPPFVRVMAALLIGVMLFAALVGVRRWRMTPARAVIAVVLFHNETGDARYEQLAQDLTDATVVALAANRRYAVIGNAAILRTPRIFTDIQTIGAALGAEYLVLGQVQNAGGTLTVRAHLIHARDQTHLWATAVSGDPAALNVQIPKTIADAVSRVLRQN